MALSLVSIFPMTNAFATPQEDMNFLKTCNVVEYTSTKFPLLYEKDGKYYKQIGGNESLAPQMARSMFVSDYYAQADGTLVANTWIYAKGSGITNFVWRYFDNNCKCLKGFQTVNGVRYYFSEIYGDLKIGWFVPKGKVSEWHYSYPDGSVKEKEGWVNSNGNWYYINSDGIMAKDTTTPDGYKINRKGICES